MVSVSQITRLLVAPLLMALAVACGGGSEPPPLPTSAVVVPVLPGNPVVVSATLRPSATPYPTFTPRPSPTVTPAPAVYTVPDIRVLMPGSDANPFMPLELQVPVTPVGYVAPESTEPAPAAVSTPAPDLGPTPVPVAPPRSYGGLPFDENGDEVTDGWVPFIHQTLFPNQIPRIPESLLTGNILDLPETSSIISSGTRYLFWSVVYDVSKAPPGWDFEGTVRWVNNTLDSGPFLMFEAPVSLSSETYQFLEGIGQSLPGFWRPGLYRVELLDRDLEEVVSWDFQVR